MMKDNCNLPHPWQKQILYFDSLPSTNDHAKQLAIQGAPEGTAVIARSQSAGRGRMGRTFHSPDGTGLYLTLILRPGCPPGELMHLTCAAAKASCDAVERCAGIRPGVKWINDLILQRKKLGGILTELSVNSKTGLVDWALIGIGINCLEQSFPPEIQNIATSLYQVTGKKISPEQLSQALLPALYDMNQKLFAHKKLLMDSYRQDCLSTGKEVILLQGGRETTVTALAIDDDGGLLVGFPDGTVTSICSGEISIRGLCGYL